MKSFSKWLEGFDFVTEPMPQPNINPEIGKGGLSDQSHLPMSMRKPPITSAFETYSKKKKKVKPRKLLS